MNYFYSMKFKAILDITARAKKLNVSDVAREVWLAEDVQELIIDLNTRKQLYELGEDSEGNSLGEYRPYTVERKKIDGLPFDRVTLYQTGEFYRSFIVVPDSQGFSIDADSIKGDKDLLDVYGEAILGLSEQSRKALVTYALSTVQAEVLYRLRHGADN